MSLTMANVVLGAGPIGLAIAYELKKRGEEVLVLSSARNTGMAGGVNAGWISPILAGPVPSPGALKNSLIWMMKRDSPLRISPSLDPRHISFMLQLLSYSNAKDYENGQHALATLGMGTLELFDSYQAQGINFELHKKGLLMAFKSTKKLESELSEYAELDKYGNAKVVPLDGNQLQKLEPALISDLAGAIHCPDQYFCDPLSYLAGMRSKLQELRVEICDSHEKIELSKIKGKVTVRIGSEVFGNTNVIVAAGVESRNLLASINVKVPIRFGKGYCFDFPQVRALSNSIYFTEAKVAVTPTDTYLRFAGTMEFGGNPLKINRHRAEGILKSGMSYLSESINVAPELKSGLRPITPDGLPVLGRLASERNLYVASGHSMLGLTLSPVTGEIIADLVTTGRTARDITAFDPQRFN